MFEIQMPQRQKVKLITLGNTDVGKTSIVNRFVNEKFNEKPLSYQPSFCKKSCTLPSGKHLQFQIWDTGNMERHSSIPLIFFRQAKIALCVYDITSRASFDYMKRWVDEAISKGPAHDVIAIVGNKCDLQANKQVADVEAMEYTEQVGGFFKLVSAKSNINIIELFSQAGEAAFSRLDPRKWGLPSLKIEKIARRASCW